MNRLFIAVLAICYMATFSAWAADKNQDGVDDGNESSMGAATLDVGDIAVVDSGHFSVGHYISRLTELGYSVTSIPEDSNLEALANYSLVILPVHHASVTKYDIFDGLSADYLEFVSSGGGLWVAQPNPYGMPDNTATITWVPYELTLYFQYNQADCPADIVDSSHCLSEGISGAGFSNPLDTVVEMGSEWEVIAQGPVSGSPSVLFATYGNGKVLVELGTPQADATCLISSEVLNRYVVCTMGSSVVAVEFESFDSLKALFR